MMNSINEIAANELEARKQKGEAIELIDVRTPAEYESVHASYARNIPLDKLDAAAVAAQRSDKSQPVYLICKSGARAKQAQQKFMAAGFGNAVCVTGGTDAWVAASLPVVRGRQTMSLERQVRIAAGTLVLIGAVLAWRVHFGFIGLSAFVGAGLVFAGITDTCGMGMLLAKMPWNQRKGCST